MIYDIHKIYGHKRSTTCVVLGNGDSINRISKNEWKVISKCDTWVLNEWLYHSFVPRFYHIELKKDFDHWKERRELKGISYDNVIFVCSKSRIERYINAIGKDQKYVYVYESRNWNPKRELLTPDFRLHSKLITKAYSASLTCLLDIIVRFNYEYIIFYGVDLHNSKYFWTNKSHIYGKPFENTNKGYPPDHPHNTAPVSKYIGDFNRMFAKPLGTRMFVGHPDTALRQELKQIDITKIKL